MKKITLLFAFLTATIGFAQNDLVEDFEGTPSLGVWSGAAATIENSPGGRTGKSMKIVTSATGDAWQGAKFTLPATVAMNLTTSKTVTMDIYTTSDIGLMGKVESTIVPGGAPAANTKAITGAASWQTITFTINTKSDGTAIASGNYNVMAFFPLRKADDSGWAAKAAVEVYIDNVKSTKETIVPPAVTAPAAAAAVPTEAAANVTSFYSDSYTSVTGVNLNPGWNQATTFSELDLSGNKAIKLTGLDYQGIDFDNNRQDVSTSTHFHFDYWTADATALQFFLIDAAGEKFYDVKTEDGITQGSWVSLNIPVAKYTSQGISLATIRQFKIVGNGTVFFDNIYFVNNQNLSVGKNKLANVSLYPNPAKNNIRIVAQDAIQSASIYNVLGKVVRTVSINDKAANIDISDLNTGVYLVKYTVGNTTGTSKFIKQ